MSTFHFALNPDGFLILGSAETIGSDTDLFGILDRTNNFFTRKIAQHGAVVSNFELDGSQERLTANFTPSISQEEPAKRVDLKGDAERAILARDVSPGVIINERMDILQFRGDTSPYLSHPSGEATVNLFNMCRPGLLVEVRTALHEATQNGGPVKKDGWIKVPQQQETAVSIDIIPFLETTTAQRYFFVQFGPRVIPAQI